ncbi:MAG: DUF3667 domain-containing protein [Xanthomonadaceae bacterium]|nr:DUF3667 domain-containing protein [Xanthomonadaceae bacterium]
MDDARDCSNCGRTTDVPGQKFCPDCGQPTPAHRIDWHFLGHELEHSVLHMDRGIFYTLKNLMFRPGYFVRDYIEGRRANHAKPFLLIMMMAALIIVLSKWFLGRDVVDAVAATAKAEAARAAGDLGAERIATVYASLNAFMSRHFAATTLALIPVEAVMFRLAFGKVGRLNYPEWLLITAFLTVQTFVLWVLSFPLQRIHAGGMNWVLLASIAYGVFTLIQLFSGYPRWKTVLRTLAGFGLFMLVQAVVMLLVTIWVVVNS